jgi:DNA-binding NarL/FixJ family response regulator
MPIRIVLVDDHQIVRESLACRLHQEADFAVVGAAASSREAYACIETTEPHLVIMDLHRPGDDGLITTRMIRRANPELKILILSGYAEKATADAVLSSGANGFLLKSDSSEELVRAMRGLMSGQTYLSLNTGTLASPGRTVPRPFSLPAPLSERELSLLRCIADGLSYKEIADELCVSVKSVDYYRAGLAKKTGCASRAELVRYAIRWGVVAA